MNTYSTENIENTENSSENIENSSVQNKFPTSKEWGPHVWYVMKVFARGLGDEQSDEIAPELYQDTIQFYTSLKTMLPCPECREHYVKYLENYPIENYLATSQTLLEWINTMEFQVKERILLKKTLEHEKKQEKLEPEQQQPHNQFQKQYLEFIQRQKSFQSQQLQEKQNTLIFKPEFLVATQTVQKITDPVRIESEQNQPFIVKQKTPSKKIELNLKSYKGVSGTPAATTTQPVNAQQARALQKLAESAKYFKRRCMGC